MKAANPIDLARKRCKILSALAHDLRITAQSRQQRWIELEIVNAGDKQSEATAKINRALDEIEGLILHVTILDMAAALEAAVESKIGNAVGKVRKARKNAEKKETFPVYSVNLIANAKSFNSLKSLASLLEGYLDADVDAGFRAARDARNLYAHGTDVTTPPLIDIDDAHLYFVKIYEML